MEKITRDLSPDGLFRRKANNMISSLQRRESEIKLWFVENGVFHPDFDKKIRELNNIRWKIEQLNDRKYRVPIDMDMPHSLPYNLIKK